MKAAGFAITTPVETVEKVYLQICYIDPFLMMGVFIRFLEVDTALTGVIM